jgi:predicted nucleotidyltransferase component of viral defense system
MISFDELKKQYPDVQGFDRSLLREYLQYKILDIIFKDKLAAKLSFLGGTALKICYGSRRFSEDLDFDNFGLTEAEFGELSEIIKKQLELEGYKIETRNVFKGAFRCYIKLPELLYQNNLSLYPAENIVIQVDTAPYNFLYEPIKFLLDKFEVYRTINLTPADIILSQKVAAIVGRKRMKGRDFYDISYLFSSQPAGVPLDFNMAYLEQKLGVNSKVELKKLLLEAIPEDLTALAGDVEPFLLNKDDLRRVLTFREYIESKL